MQPAILVVNTGSASIKTRLFDAALQTRAELTADCASLPQVVVEGRDWRGAQVLETVAAATMEECLRMLFARWRTQLGGLPVTLLAVGHRIVHGGGDFGGLTVLDAGAMRRLAQYDGYAPLHNPLNRLGVTAAAETFPAVPQYGVFDTAFHRTLPEYARRYAVPKELADSLGLHRYGFHGIACRQALHKTAQFLRREEASLNMIVLHLGGGASATAIRGGLSADTSMGFSPLDGLMMASRCGDVDPMLPLTLLQHGRTPEEVQRLLNRDSGVTGICGSTDMRTVLERARGGDTAAELALDMYCYRIKKYIGAYCAVLGKVDALVFSGGVGENAPEIRGRILAGLEPFGLILDAAANRQRPENVLDIGAPRGAVRILALRVNEEREIAGQIQSRLESLSSGVS